MMKYKIGIKGEFSSLLDILNGGSFHLTWYLSSNSLYSIMYYLHQKVPLCGRCVAYIRALGCGVKNTCSF